MALIKPRKRRLIRPNEDAPAPARIVTNRDNGGPPLVGPGFNTMTPRQWEAVELLRGPQRHTLLVGGSRSGKTTLIVMAIIYRALMFPGSRHVIFRHRQNAVRATVGLDTLPKARKLFFPKVKMAEQKSAGYWLLPNGSEIWLAGLDDKERVEKILGFEYASIYFNECSQIPWASADTALTRLAQVVDGCVQRAYYDLNPGGNRHWTYRQFFERKMADSNRELPDGDFDYKHLTINPSDNKANLSPKYLQALANASERTRRRFFEGVYSPEMDGALWSVETLDKARQDPITPAQARERFQRIAIGVDPSGTSGDPEKRSDDIGIIVAGREPIHEGAALAGILEDATFNAHPKVWSKKIADLVKKWNADVIVAEKNYGGEMVRHTIEGAMPYANVKLVTASKGKAIRAEPVAAEYSRDRVHHYGRFEGLEEEMLQMGTDKYHGPRSPNRLDAAVFALAELFGKTVVPDDALIYVGAPSFFATERW